MAALLVDTVQPSLAQAVKRCRKHKSRLVLSDQEQALVGFTQANFVYLIYSALGTPYLFGGIDPFHGGADCSGLIYWACAQLGYHCPRTTDAEWADLPGSSNWAAAPYASLIEFEVPGDGGAPPQHVGVVTGAGAMIDDPHTGAVVSVQQIPNNSAIWPIGYRLLPFDASPPPPPPPPPPPKEKGHRIVSTVKEANGNLVSMGITTPSAHLIEITRTAGDQGEGVGVGLSIIDFTAQWTQFTVQEIIDVVLADNGDIVTHILTPQDHYVEVTRKSGYAGQKATAPLPDGSGSVSIEDFTAAFPQFDIEP